MIRSETPAGAAPQAPAFGSDVVAHTLRDLDVPFIALNPGASFRGLHDSLVNFLGNARPQLLLCLHEEHAVAIAHGYAKASGRMMGVALHSNVGLLHGAMGIFNAWCDRIPMLVLGATGPVDAAQRRPWIEWIHTARDQGALVRDYTKWDDQPASPEAAREALLRAAQLAQTAPCGPTYVCLDVTLQEAPLAAPLPAIDVARFAPGAPGVPANGDLARAAQLLADARRPLLLVGRVAADANAWRHRVALAEHLQARVLTDLKARAGFPTAHPLHVVPPAFTPGDAALAAIRDADVIVSLDWIDLAGTLKQAAAGGAVNAKVIHASLDSHAHRGWSADYQGLPPCDVHLLCEPDALVHALLARHVTSAAERPAPVSERAPEASRELNIAAVARAVQAAADEQPVSLLRVPLGWNAAHWPFAAPEEYIGYDGGGGIGSGPGMAVGAALALAGSGRLPVAITGDGDFLMGVTALWTAARYRVPLLLVVCNNRSFFNDELHQERVARRRGRPVENRWIGQRIADPDIDLAAMARAQGAIGIGPVETLEALDAALAEAVAAVRSGAVAVVDVRVPARYEGNA